MPRKPRVHYKDSLECAGGLPSGDLVSFGGKY